VDSSNRVSLALFVRSVVSSSSSPSPVKAGDSARRVGRSEPPSSPHYSRRRILADVPHVQWVFSLPKMLRPYFLFHRELLGELSRIAYETVREMMASAVDKPDARPGMVAVIQTFGSSLKWNPHLLTLVSRGVWARTGRWLPIPFVDTHKAELLFRHKVLRCACFEREPKVPCEYRVKSTSYGGSA